MSKTNIANWIRGGLLAGQRAFGRGHLALENGCPGGPGSSGSSRP
jgi:hypothetical protein